MNYIGSKTNLLNFLKTEIKKVAGDDLSGMLFCDLFAGTGAVGRSFKNEVRQVISNDLEYYSYVLNYNAIKNSCEIADKESYIDLLNGLHVKSDGIIFNHYCRGGKSGRQYFSDENGKKIDAARARIEALYQTKEINEALYMFLIASLLESADRIANTASVYGSFLKYTKKSAMQELKILPAEFELSKNAHEVYNFDANQLIKKVQGDILYLDPPYNHRQYGANYHLLNTIALYDDVVPQGKTGVREYISSSYCKKSEVYKSFEQLIGDARFRYIFMSYNNEAYMHQDEIKNIMSKYGDYSFVKKEHKRFKSYKKYRASTDEHLHILRKEEY